MSKYRDNLQKGILLFLKQKRAAKLDSILEYMLDTLGTKKRKVEPKYSVQRTLKTLADSGEIAVYKDEYGEYATLTPEGRQKLRSISLASETSLLPTVWDGKWRVVILDVPEEAKQLRDALRYLLKKAQFVCYKNSVWITPYPLEHFVAQMKEDLGLSTELSLIVTAALDRETEESFRSLFGKK